MTTWKLLFLCTLFLSASAGAASNQWICLIRNTHFSRTFVGKATTEIDAQYEVQTTCERSGNWPENCDKSTLNCAPILSPRFSAVCLVTNTRFNKTFRGKGRNWVEAKAEAFQNCETDGNWPENCVLSNCSE